MTKTDKREEIVRAALELIAERGYHGTPMALIAEQAKVGAGTIYRYFANKDVLITELYQEVENRVYPVITAGYEVNQPFRQRFFHVLKALLKYFTENPLDFRYVEQFHNSPYGVAFRRERLLVRREERDVCLHLFDEGVSKKLLKDLPLSILLALAFGPILSVARDHVLGFLPLDDRLIDETIKACWDAVKTPAAEPEERVKS